MLIVQAIGRQPLKETQGHPKVSLPPPEGWEEPGPGVLRGGLCCANPLCVTQPRADLAVRDELGQMASWQPK